MANEWVFVKGAFGLTNASGNMRRIGTDYNASTGKHRLVYSGDSIATEYVDLDYELYNYKLVFGSSSNGYFGKRYTVSNNYPSDVNIATNGTLILDSKYWYNDIIPVAGSTGTRNVNLYRQLKNSQPTITPVITPTGTYETKPLFDYTVADADGHQMTITESIDGVVFNTLTNVTSGTTLTYTPSDLAWLRTRINQTVNITITADDGNGGITTVNYPVTRTTPAIDLQLKTPFETDVSARRILLQLEGNIPNDAIVNVQACNNAFDVSPTWENATNLVLSGFPYPFSNTTKTATKWGVSFKVRIERGDSTEPIYIDGIGGAFD